MPAYSENKRRDLEIWSVKERKTWKRTGPAWAATGLHLHQLRRSVPRQYHSESPFRRLSGRDRSRFYSEKSSKKMTSPSAVAPGSWNLGAWCGRPWACAGRRRPARGARARARPERELPPLLVSWLCTNPCSPWVAEALGPGALFWRRKAWCGADVALSPFHRTLSSSTSLIELWAIVYVGSLIVVGSGVEKSEVHGQHWHMTVDL